MSVKNTYLPIITCLLAVIACQEKRQFPKERKLSSFNISTHIPTLEGIPFQSGIRRYTLDRAWQRTAFILDEVGAELESEAIIYTSEEIVTEKTQSKRLIFNKPFTLFLKKANSVNPYFGMWVADTELLIME
jgi:hypothetical protein